MVKQIITIGFMLFVALFQSYESIPAELPAENSFKFN